MTPFATAVQAECDRASELYGPMANMYEALGVILEEIDEFKAEVWKKKSERSHVNMGRELVQIGAMLQRTVENLSIMGLADADIIKVERHATAGALALRNKLFQERVAKFMPAPESPKIASAHHGYMLILSRYSKIEGIVFHGPEAATISELVLQHFIEAAVAVERTATDLELVPE